MANMVWKCSNCNADIEVSVAQNVGRKGLGWSASYNCSECGAVIEMDDDGFPPSDVRMSIIDSTGLYCLVIEDNQGVKVKVAKALMSLFDLTINRSMEFARRAIENGGIRGTIHEVKWIGEKLKETGVAAEIEEGIEDNSVDVLELLS